MDEIEIDNQNLTVVEGWLTDLDTIQIVKLSLSQSFLDNSALQYITTAQVTISGDNGDNLTLSHQGDGVYSTSINYAGQPGVGYSLTIQLNDDRVITSQVETMSSAPEIDTLGYDVYEKDSDSNQNIIDEVYYPITQIHDDGDEENYYRWKLYRNDTLFSEADEIILISDRFFNGNAPLIESEFTIFEYSLYDSISIELNEITEAGYDYLRVLKTQTTTLGSISSVTPSPITGNLHYINSNETVLGFWGTASVQKAGVKIIP